MARSRKNSRSKVHFAPVEAVEDYLEEVNQEILTCRDQGRHRWKQYDIDGDSKVGFTRYFRCPCKAMLAQQLDAAGYIVGKHVSYPKGYLMPAGTGRLSREGNAVIRRTSAQRAVLRLNLRAQKQAS